MTHPKIMISAPALVGNEKAYVLDCLDTNWISSIGKYINLFEEKFAEFCEVKHAISVSNGTVALHTALLGLGIGPGDEVIVPTLTYVASANAVTYCGATPVFVDSELMTGNMDVSRLEAAITPRTKAIMVVHLYGHPVDMDVIAPMARRHNLYIIEDAAEAHGAEYRGRKVGSLGDVATFSFYGNKIITTGEGGMITTQDDALATRMRQIRGQGQDPNRRYWFPIVGYNYRMTNIAAAIGLGQLENIEWHLEQRRQVAAWYREYLRDVPSVTLPTVSPDIKHAHWMNCVVLNQSFPISRDQLMLELAERGIESRPYFYPMHILPMYARPETAHQFPVADYLGAHGLNLPTHAEVTRSDVAYISEVLGQIARQGAKALAEVRA